MPIPNPFNPDANPLCDVCGELMAATGSGFQCEHCVSEALGKVVREAWTAYCLRTGDFKPSHIAPWEFLSDWDKEADREIGRVVAKYVVKNRISATWE